jgi:hypothetical protein
VSALLDLTYASPERAASFNCLTCRDRVKKLRRCKEDREDFTFEKDGNPWPIQIDKGGETYGFCPGKVTWRVENSDLLRLLIVGAETGVMIRGGGLADQPSWWIDLLGWFIPKYDAIKFASKARQVLGDGSKTKKG